MGLFLPNILDLGAPKLGYFFGAPDTGLLGLCPGPALSERERGCSEREFTETAQDLKNNG